MSLEFLGAGIGDVEGEKLLIDGSNGEGGGQIIRNAVTLACILARKIEVINIRANRPNPGLASQHLESIKAMLNITAATTSKELKKQDTQFDLDATRVVRLGAPGAEMTIDLKTAGSITLCMQCILPYLLCLKSPSKIRIIGGTHVMKSPSFDYLKRVFIPTFNTLIENNVEAVMVNPGYFPKGGGNVDLVVYPKGKFFPVNLTERGPLKKIEAILNVTPKMKGHITHYKNMINVDTRNIEVRIVSYASVEYFVHCEKSNAGFSFLVEGRNPDANDVFQAIAVVQKEMKTFLDSTATVDSYLQDQLIIYMNLAKLSDPKSQNRIKTLKPTDHTQSSIHVCQSFCPNNIFEIVKNADESFDIVL